MAFCEGAEADMHMYFDKAGKYVCYYSCIVPQVSIANQPLLYT